MSENVDFDLLDEMGPDNSKVCTVRFKPECAGDLVHLQMLIVEEVVLISDTRHHFAIGHASQHNEWRVGGEEERTVTFTAGPRWDPGRFEEEVGSFIGMLTVTDE